MSTTEVQSERPATGAPHETHLGRRQFVRLGAAGAAAAVGGGYAATDDADALIPAVVVGVAAGAGLATGWVLGEWDPLQSDSVPEGLTPGAFKQQAYQIALTRQSTNASAILDTENLVTASKNDAYAKGKISGVEALNDQLTESEVVDAAHAAVDKKEAKVKGNLLKDWNESVNELQSMFSTATDHPDVNWKNVFEARSMRTAEIDSRNPLQFPTRTVTLPDGSEMDVRRIQLDQEVSGNSPNDTWDPAGKDTTLDGTKEQRPGMTVLGADGNVVYLAFPAWNAVWNQIETAYSEVRNGLSNWVSTVYADVQAGELNPEELFTPAELAKLMPDGEGYPQALADLMALGYAVDLERKMTIDLSNVDGTISGTMGLSDKPSEPLQSGETIDPTARAEDYYFTYDVSKGTGVWSDYEVGIDGGVITFTSDPYEQSLYTIETTAGESIEVGSSRFTETDTGGAWTYDASAELENEITEIESVSFAADVEGTHFETVQLEQQFTITEIVNEETGETVDSTSFTQSETQTDNNYITQSEWDELREQNEKLIEKYEKAKNSGGIFSGLFGGGSIFGGGASGLALWAVGGAAAVIGVSKLAEGGNDGRAR